MRANTDGGTTRHGDGDALLASADLSSRLQFSVDEGMIWLDDQRMVLFHTKALAELRRELIEMLGKDRARGVLTRLGYAAGARDAQLALKLRRDCDADPAAFLIGTQLNALEGVCSVEPIDIQINVARGTYFGDFYWHNSSEDEMHIQTYGLGAEPVCWTQTGYASGFTSVFMGKLILYREIECRGMGQPKCRVIGKSIEDWDDPEEDLRQLQPEAFANAGSLHRGTRTHLLADLSGAAPPPPLADGMVGVSAPFNAACHMLSKVAESDATVLFLGESGVGKEKFARTLHSISARRDRPFVAVNCAALPESLLESELFGAEKGAFTGAAVARPGRFERADTGTIFLDEIGSLSMAAQAKLLRVLQEGELERLGDTRTRRINVRVIAATNVDLRTEMRAKRFRDDLFYRLNVFPVRLAPLRERREDIPHLVTAFVSRYARKYRKNPTGFTEKAVQALMAYEWPGNIRELENMVERGVLLAPDGGPIDLCHLFTGGETVTSVVLGLAQTRNGARLANKNADDDAAANPSRLLQQLIGCGIDLETIDKLCVEIALESCGGNVAAAARKLGISRAQMAYRTGRRS